MKTPVSEHNGNKGTGKTPPPITGNGVNQILQAVSKLRFDPPCLHILTNLKGNQ